MIRACAGVTGLITTVTVGTEYVDAGATAMDNVDKDLTAKISTTLTAEIDTFGPTDPEAPYVVSYDVSDSANNKASTVRRR